MIRHLLLLAGIADVLGAQPTSAAGWHIEVLDLVVQVTPDTRLLSISGSLRIRLQTGRSSGPTLVLGAGGVAFDSGRVDPAGTVSLSPARDSLLVRLAEIAAAGREVVVHFHAHTDRDLGRSLIRREGAMISWGALWYPVLAWHRDSVPDLEFPGTTRITVPAAWRTLSPGALTDSTVAGGQRTELWRMTRPTARSFVAAPFVSVWVQVDGRPVAVYLLPRHASRAREYADAIPRMVQRLSAHFGPYPFPAFGIAELPREVAPPGFGGRSEPGYFIAHTDALEGAGVNVPLFAHELTHMWFPNAADSRPPGDDMMDEAIATYGVVLYRETLVGRARARREIIDGSPDFSMRAYFHEARRGVDEPLMADYSPVIARAKGPMVYDMLRRRLGDSVFFGMWRDFAAQGGSVSLADLRRAYQERVPADTELPEFLAQWMDRPGMPVVEPSWSSRRLGEVTFSQRGDPYVLDIPVRVRGALRTLDTTLHIGKRVETFALPVGAIRSVELDPEDELLLWKERFGPPPHAPASWTLARWLRWMAEEVPWLMRSYQVRGVSVALIRGGKLAWTRGYGSDPPSATGPARALIDSLRKSSDTAIRRQTTVNEVVTLSIGRVGEHAGMVVVARGGWGGPQLTLHLAQRVALQERWAQVPR